MKRSSWLRLPFTVLPLVSILALFSSRASVLGSFRSAFPAAVTMKLSNETLLHPDSDDPYEAMMRTDIDSLLAGNFPITARSTYSVWRNRAGENPRRNIGKLLLGSEPGKDFRNYPIFLEIQRSLLKWWRNRRFQAEVISELVRLVKRPLDLHAGRPDSDHRYTSCAVVGNSGILLNAEHGDLIDRHELVIRLNNARTHGFHRNVGSKTGLSFINSNILHLCARRGGCSCHPYGDAVPVIMYMCQAVHFLDYTICNSSHTAPLLITDIRFDMLCSRIVKHYSLKRFVESTGKPVEEWPKYHEEKAFHYSSGMQAVMLALGICDRVSVFGFGKSPEAKHHYHTNQRAELDLHDYEAEYALYRDLVGRPELVPFLQDSGFRVPPLAFYH